MIQEKREIPDIKYVRNFFKTWFLSRGFSKTNHRDIFFKDQGFYLICAEIEPIHDVGFFLNFVVHFLWDDREYITYDYYLEQSRIFGQEKPKGTGLTFFDSPNFKEEIEYMTKQAEHKLQIYSNLTDPAVLENRLLNKTNYIRPEYKKIDQDLAIILALRGKRFKAYRLFANASKKSPKAMRLKKICFNKTKFENEVLSLINGSRARLSAIYKVKLEKIPTIF